ncbi:MAG: vWA domain-containing protein [Planctomycetota bacterium]
MQRFIVLIALSALTFGPWSDRAAASQDASDRRPVDLAICLDVSGSMQNLLDSVRGRIWDIVTDLSRATPMPRLRVALISFGGEEASSDGFIIRHTDFTDDLDTVYSKLMSLEPKGGEEYVGWAIETAVESLSWSDDSDGLRVIFVAGNESADQNVDEHDFRKAAVSATERDILINTVFAGGAEIGVSEKWDLVAQLGKGTYNAIDVVRGTIQIDTPYDSELVKLNEELNRTYLPYGKKGAEGLANQLAQDQNAGKMGIQSCGSRVAAKGCALYNVASWDLVDAVQVESFRLESIEPDDLPVFMRVMTQVERKAYVSGMREVRDAIKKEIAGVDQNRQAYIRAAQVGDGEQGRSLDDAVLTSLREQAIARGFSFPKSDEKPVVKLTAEVEGPTVPTRELKPPARANVDGLMTALPILEYAVDAYRSQRRSLADRLAGSVGSPVTIMLGDRTFTSTDLANKALIQLLKVTAEELEAIRMVNAAPLPFAYAPEFAAPAPSTGVTLCYRIGGIDFADRATAERVRDDIRKALEAHQQLQASRPSTGGSAQLVSSTNAESTEAERAVERYRETIKLIAETAGLSYMMLIDGC